MFITLINKGTSIFVLILFLLAITLIVVYGYLNFIVRERQNNRKIQKLINEKKWNEFLEESSSDNELFDQVKHFIKNYSIDINREHSSQLFDKQVQISTLQNQINPHFLYNTMESIRGQALAEGSIEIAQMSEALSSFFRYSIDQKGNFVTIQEELKNIQNYIFIQSYRFQDKFVSLIDVDEEDSDVYDYLLPKLTIQPIVENAIYHGLEMKGEKGTIKIKVNTTDKRLLVTISDDGVGMNSETLDNLNHKLQDWDVDRIDDMGSISTGLALINVNKRIKLIFGNDYGIYVYSTLNIGTDVEIVMPVIKDKAKLFDDKLNEI